MSTVKVDFETKSGARIPIEYATEDAASAAIATLRKANDRFVGCDIFHLDGNKETVRFERDEP